MEIQMSTEGPRGCGYRKEGGLYMVSGKLTDPCGKLPMELTVCPTCSQGIKPARGWTWIRPRELFGTDACSETLDVDAPCDGCPAGPASPEKGGLIWIGQKFYKTTEAFLEEAGKMGVSRRITAVPKGFKLGEDFVYLAHREAVPQNGAERLPGVFCVFKPQRIEKVVGIVKDPSTGECFNNLPDEPELAALQKRGITPVIIDRREVNGEIFQEAPA